jgi:hypothetical protein
MKTILLATAAIVGLAAGGTAIIERAHVNLQQLAQGLHPQSDTTRNSVVVAGGWYPGATQQHAANGKPQPATDMRGTAYARGWHPQPDTSRGGTQYAASGLPQSDTTRRSQV